MCLFYNLALYCSDSLKANVGASREFALRRAALCNTGCRILSAFLYKEEFTFLTSSLKCTSIDAPRPGELT